MYGTLLIAAAKMM